MKCALRCSWAHSNPLVCPDRLCPVMFPAENAVSCGASLRMRSDMVEFIQCGSYDGSKQISVQLPGTVRIIFEAKQSTGSCELFKICFSFDSKWFFFFNGLQVL